MQIISLLCPLVHGWFTGIWHEGHVVAMMPHALSIKGASVGQEGSSKRLYLAVMHQIHPELLTVDTGPADRSGSLDGLDFRGR